MHPLTKLKNKRYEATIRRLKLIIAKRNTLFHKIRRHFERPETALAVMVQMTTLRMEWEEQGLYLMDYLILLGVKDKNLFYYEDVENIILTNAVFYEHRKHTAPWCLNRLIKLGYVRMYHKRKVDNYFITTEGRVFLNQTGREVFKRVRNTLK